MRIFLRKKHGKAIELIPRALRETLVDEAVQSLQEALSMTSGALRQSHNDVWSALWTTGFGISR